MESRSRSKAKNRFAFCLAASGSPVGAAPEALGSAPPASAPAAPDWGLISRLNPVPIGSMKTRSLNLSQDSSLVFSRDGGGGAVPLSLKATRCGPSAPRWRYADDAPGPPLNTNVTGRSASCSSRLPAT